MGVSLQVLRLNLDGEIDIVGREGLPRINRLPRELGVVENLEGNTNRNALVRARSQWLSSRPQKDGIVERVTLSEVFRRSRSGSGRATYTGNSMSEIQATGPDPSALCLTLSQACGVGMSEYSRC